MALSNDAGGIDALRRMRLISTAGATLDEQTAAKIVGLDGPRLENMYGSTELQVPAVKQLPQEDWPYMSFHKRNCIRMDHYKENMHELVVKKDDEMGDWQPGMALIPDGQEYHTKDLFSPHPTKPGLWRHRGRIDDVVLLSNGQKILTTDIDKKIEQCPQVSGVLVIGGARRLVAVVELRKAYMSRPPHRPVGNKYWTTFGRRFP